MTDRWLERSPPPVTTVPHLTPLTWTVSDPVDDVLVSGHLAEVVTLHLLRV